MLTLNLKYVYLPAAFLVVLAKTLYCQMPDFSKVPNLHEGDSLNITYLINHGTKISSGKVIAWFPNDSLSKKQMDQIMNMINAGINGAEKCISAPLPWQLHQPDEPYTFYFRYDHFISHASQAGFVSIPFWRIKEGKAPWLHEAVHEMLSTKTGSWLSPELTEREWAENMPSWLFEGLPDYISLKVSLLNNLPWFDVFSNSQQTNIDSLFIREIASDKGPYILSHIGSKGVMQELNTNDRMLYAPAFYHGSCSFVKWLVENYNMQLLLTGISSFGEEQARIEQLTGKSLGSLKKEWLDNLKITK